MEQKETQPAEMPSGPICSRISRSKIGLNIPTAKAKGAANASFFSSTETGSPALATRKIGQHLIRTEGYDADDEGESGKQFGARIKAVDRRFATGKSVEDRQVEKG